jgi:hypothetical protein
MALLPESVADRYQAPGVRFLPLAGEVHAFTAVVGTRRDSARMPTAAFLRAVAQAERPRPLPVAPAALSAA